jgi:lauroyl/myristoyl acyltransferase
LINCGLRVTRRTGLLPHVAASAINHLGRRLGLCGDLPGHLARRMTASMPWFLEAPLIFGWAFIFFWIAKPQRQAVAANLRAMHPQWGNTRAVLGAWRVFWSFSVTYVDGLRCESGTGDIDWAIEGLDDLNDLATRPAGCVILTAHMGNYDIAAPMFSSRIHRALYAVRAPEKHPELQKIRERELREKEITNPNFRTLYNEEGSLLGVELARLLTEGNLVAVQGDRVVFDVSPMDVEIEPGLHMRLPRGPLFLVRATGAPCFPLFIMRDGWRRYRVKVMPPLELPERVRGPDSAAAQLWAKTILEVVRGRWNQWFVFEKVLWRDGPPG